MSTTWVRSVSRRVRLLATVAILAELGMSEPALRVAGGILLLLIGIDMVLPATQAACRRPTTSAPLIAGPGTMSAIAC